MINIVNWFKPKILNYENLEKLNAKQESQLLRIYMGKNSEKQLSNKEIKKAIQILKKKS